MKTHKIDFNIIWTIYNKISLDPKPLELSYDEKEVLSQIMSHVIYGDNLDILHAPQIHHTRI